MIYAGAEDYVVELLAQESISASRAAELLDVSVHRLARERGVEASSTVEDHKRGSEAARKLLR